MRALIMVAAATLPLAACGERKAEQAAGNPEETGAAAANFSTNDTTAIDAATGDAANMAADVNYTVNVTDNAIGNDSGTRGRSRPAVADNAGANSADD